MFSARTAWNLEQSAHAESPRPLPVYDLTASNPTRCGFTYDERALLAPLADRAALTYDPVPFGLERARCGVAAYYADHGAAVEHEQICLTTSTSEAYSYLFRLLCDPGDEVLIAQPSYPLFDFLAALDDVRLVPFPLFYEPGHGWQMEPDALGRSITPRTRAIAVVHPNNPTGHAVSREERALLEAVCREHDLALIVDEVFLDYPLSPEPLASFAAGPHPALTFVLSGLSKVAALPQMKAAWLVCCGPEPLVQPAVARLEVIADTFLSMNAPVQHALPAWLGQRSAIQEQIRHRTLHNLAALDLRLQGATAVSRLLVEAGWYCTLRVPAIVPDAELVLRLLDRGVALHPGSAFGFPEAGFLVVSLLAPEAEFSAGIEQILEAVDGA